MNFILVCLTASIQPLRIQYQRISIKLQAMKVAKTAPKVQGVVA